MSIVQVYAHHLHARTMRRADVFLSGVRAFVGNATRQTPAQTKGTLSVIQHAAELIEHRPMRIVMADPNAIIEHYRNAHRSKAHTIRGRDADSHDHHADMTSRGHGIDSGEQGV